MDNREEVRRYLASRRARLTPEQVGLPSFGRRRVAGLRREEVAQLAGVSVDYYTRLERGNLSGVSDSILHAIARALRLDDDEQLHLFDLARGAELRPTATRPARSRHGRPAVRDSIRAIVDGLVDLPACVTNGRMELVMTNPLARALYDPMFTFAASSGRGVLPSHARFVFLDPAATSFWIDWETAATEVVGALRIAAARDPYDKDLTDLVGELATRSDHFRTWWGSHDVFIHRGGVKRINHATVGRLDLTYEVMHFPFDPDIALLTYSAAPGTPTHDNLQLLAAWNATRTLTSTAYGDLTT